MRSSRTSRRASVMPRALPAAIPARDQMECHATRKGPKLSVGSNGRSRLFPRFAGSAARGAPHALLGGRSRDATPLHPEERQRDRDREREDQHRDELRLVETEQARRIDAQERDHETAERRERAPDPEDASLGDPSGEQRPEGEGEADAEEVPDELVADREMDRPRLAEGVGMRVSDADAREAARDRVVLTVDDVADPDVAAADRDDVAGRHTHDDRAHDGDTAVPDLRDELEVIAVEVPAVDD